ncbi:hypothetical protein [Leptothermofonsia sichuanensis]|uniref:hypothetical protein n=1 Tax=Leptothermofonsia sichuanensis TaxID=2917832 RepID=UPI001CEDBF41|nr:hypothetical protein [Leptothermofonsia sichuanensis]
MTDTEAASNQAFQQEIERLHQLTVYGRWLVVGLLWLTVGSLSLWGLRHPISLILDHFTWAAVRYGLAFHRLSAIGLAVCVGSTLGVLIWQSRNILVGLSDREKKRLEQQLYRIRQQGPTHPLWKFICQR